MGARTDSALSARAIRGAEVDKLARARSPAQRRRLPPGRLSLGERGETSTRFRSTKELNWRSLRPSSNREDGAHSPAPREMIVWCGGPRPLPDSAPQTTTAARRNAPTYVRLAAE